MSHHFTAPVDAEPMIQVLSASLEKAEDAAGIRLLIERPSPVALARRPQHIDVWLKDIAPSPGLDAWFQRSAKQWDSFRDRYFRELLTKPRLLAELLRFVRSGPVSLICIDGDKPFSVTAALKEWIEANWSDFHGEERSCLETHLPSGRSVTVATKFSERRWV
jgi:uncharacterized protein YeaO (DUF488 family)